MTTSRLTAPFLSWYTRPPRSHASLHPSGSTASTPTWRLRETVKGDLSGVLETLFHEHGDGTRITFSWYVRLTNPVLNLLGYVAERMYRHSHDSVMNSGEKGLLEYCQRQTSTGASIG